MQNRANSADNRNVLSLANRISQHGANYPSLSAEHYRQLRHHELAMELTQKLHLSVEIEDIISTLLFQTQKLVALDGISYQFSPLDLTFSTPVESRHKAHYQLNFEQQPLGKISFNRRMRFEPEELIRLENLLSCLLYPLRNSLKYHAALSADIHSPTDPLSDTINR